MQMNNGKNLQCLAIRHYTVRLKHNFFALKIMYVNLFWFRLVISDKSNYYNLKYQIQK